MVNINMCSTEKSKPKRVNVNACSIDKSESKSVHEIDINVNTSKVQYTKYEEPLVIVILLIKEPGFLKLFDCDK